MLKNLSIKNFRLFGKTSFSDLSRVNIFTGTNGCGKTSVLEAAYLVAGATNASLAMILYNLRGESALTPNFDRPFRSLFLDLDPSLAIEIRAEGDFKKTKRSAVRFLRIEAMRGGMPVSRSTKEDAPVSGLSFKFTGAHGTETGKIFWESTAGTANRPTGNQSGFRLRTEPVKNRDVINGYFSTPYYRELWPQAHKLLTDLTKTGGVQRVVEQLKIVEPRIKNLLPLSDGGIDTIYVDIGRKALLPVSLLGSGFANALHIFLDAAALDSGLLLFDEIEIGLHHSVISNIVETLYRSVREKNIQIFITTHSEEMLKVFADVSIKLRFSDIAIFKLRKTDDGVTYDRFSTKDVSASQDFHGELR